jgi:hypothetical protein
VLNVGVVTTAVIDAPLDAVWSLISDFAVEESVSGTTTTPTPTP